MASKSKSSFLPQKGSQKVRQLHFDQPWLRENTPALYEVLTVAIVDGEVRKAPTLVFFSQDGHLKVCIRDKETSQNGYVTLPGEDNPILEVEAAIQSGALEWRADDKKAKPVF